MFKLKPGVSPARRDEWLEMTWRVKAVFDSLEDVREYADHPLHLSAVELSEHIVSVDFEV
jgi:hypothetical protein